VDPDLRRRLHRVVAEGAGFVVEAGRGDPVEWEGFAMALRQEDGALSLAVYARESREAGWPAASGSLAFALLVKAEEERSEVPAIVGIWYNSSDNYKQFREARMNGLSPTVAATSTFTGRQAARHGFCRVESLVEESDVIRVRFTR
jgi:hypothetical protein